MSRLDRVINHILKHLNYQADVEMTPLDELQVVIVRFAVRKEHPQPLHNFRLNDFVGAV